MELQEIDDRLNKLEREIEELEGRKEAFRLMQQLLKEQDNLLKKVIVIFKISY